MGVTAQHQHQHSQACSQCCPRYHEAVELVGKRWTGAILYVLLHGGRLRFTEIANAVPDLSDRLLSERMKELEQRKIVAAPRQRRHADQGLLRADREGPSARAGDGRAEGLGGPLVGLSPT